MDIDDFTAADSLENHLTAEKMEVLAGLDESEQQQAYLNACASYEVMQAYLVDPPHRPPPKHCWI